MVINIKQQEKCNAGCVTVIDIIISENTVSVEFVTVNLSNSFGINELSGKINVDINDRLTISGLKKLAKEKVVEYLKSKNIEI